MKNWFIAMVFNKYLKVGLQTDLQPIRNSLFGYAKIDLIQNMYEKVG